MPTVSILNTTAQLTGKTVIVAENDHTVTGNWTYDNDPAAPFVVTAGSAVVTNLDADKLDGVEAASFLRSDAADTKDTGDLTFNDDIKVTLGTGGDADLSYDGTHVVLDTAIVGSGELLLTQGKINFPDTQVPSSDANTLDDYAEGPFTPTIGGSGGQSGQAYSLQIGRYVKIGKLVFCQGRVTLSTLGTITTNVQIQGLPFTAENTSNLYGGASIHYWQNMTATPVFMAGIVDPNGTAITLEGATSGSATLGAFVQADLAATTDFIFSCTYRATA